MSSLRERSAKSGARFSASIFVSCLNSFISCVPSSSRRARTGSHLRKRATHPVFGHYPSVLLAGVDTSTQATKVLVVDAGEGRVVASGRTGANLRRPPTPSDCRTVS